MDCDFFALFGCAGRKPYNMLHTRMMLENHPLAGPVIRLTHNGNHALVALAGAQVVQWHFQGRDMLWCASTRLPGKPLRGGIPVCWPWFGPHPTDATQPAHGIARLRPWQVLTTTPQKTLLSLTEGPLTAELEILLGTHLHVNLTTHNHGPTPVHLTAALHTYLKVSDITRTRITGLHDIDYIDQLDNDTLKRQHSDLSFNGETDRIYASGTATVHTPKQTVTIDSSSTSTHTVVWNPWTEKSARLGDMTPTDYHHMVCVESAWSLVNSRIIPSGEQATLSTLIQPLA